VYRSIPAAGTMFLLYFEQSIARKLAVLATLARPFGGWIADKIGGARVLHAAFLAIAPLAL